MHDECAIVSRDSSNTTGLSAQLAERGEDNQKLANLLSKREDLGHLIETHDTKRLLQTFVPAQAALDVGYIDVYASDGALRLSVTAEGIETTQQATHLQALGCRRGQGFLYARPTPIDQLNRSRSDSAEYAA